MSIALLWVGCQPKITCAIILLMVNSGGVELEGSEMRAARLCNRRIAGPRCDSQEVDCDRRDDVLQVGFGKSLIAGAA